MAAQPTRSERTKAALKVALLGTVIWQAIPPFYYGGVNVIDWAAIGCAVYAVPPLLTHALINLADMFDRLDAKIATGLKGTGGFVKSIHELHGLLKPTLFDPAHGSYWGMLCGKAIFTELPAVSLIVGTTGSGKDSTHQDINLFSVTGNKVVWDFKGDTACKFAVAFRRMKKIVNVLNADDEHEGILGESATYNHNDIINDNFTRDGGILDVHADLTEQAFTIYPEPDSNGEGDGNFFRLWSRALILFSNVTGILITGKNATLADALAMLQDRESLLHHAKYACGRLEQEDGSTAQLPIHESPWVEHQSDEDVANFAKYYAMLGTSIADKMKQDDQRQFDSFLSGAVGEMSDLNVATRAHKKSKVSSFRFFELKDERQDGRDVIDIITGSETRKYALKKFYELTNSAMLKELIRHPNKHKKVTFYLNEITNFKFKELVSLMTWCRAYNVNLIIYIQSLDAFEKAYGKHGLKVLMSEAEIKLFLPKQREPETLKYLKNTLGDTSYMNLSHSGKRQINTKMESFRYSEESWPVMTEDEIRRTEFGILLLGNNRPALVELPSIAEVMPFRNWQGVSPFYGKKYLKRVKYRIWRYYPWMPNVLIARGIAALKRAHQTSKNKRPSCQD
ncbi:MAG: hypothetical protein COA69_08580 [Robiginitomaculum sp.]|nr:MAG: hypothetical protein COA69_08580 [Robiginitomaculum sp.]